MLRRLTLLAVAATLAVPAAALADWTPPTRVLEPQRGASLLGFAAPGDAPALLVARRSAAGANVLELRQGAPSGTRRLTLARSTHSFGGASGDGSALGAADGGDLSAAWLQVVDGVRRPVVATGPRLDHRQILTGAGSAGSTLLAFAANREGGAVVAFGRPSPVAYEAFDVLVAYRPPGRPFGPAQVAGTGRSKFPVVAIGENGTAVVGWGAADGVEVAERPAGAGAFGPATTLPGSGDTPIPSLALAEGDDGRGIAAWTRYGRPGLVDVAVRPAGSAAWSNPTNLDPGGAEVRTATPPAVVVDGALTYVAWTQARNQPVAHDRIELAVRRGGVWGTPLTFDPGIRGRALRGQLVAPSLGRPAAVVAMAGYTRRVVTATVRPNGTLGPRRTIRLAGGGTLSAPAMAAQGSRSTWLAFPWVVDERQSVLLTRSRVG